MSRETWSRLFIVVASLLVPSAAICEPVDVLAISHDYGALLRTVIVVTPVPQPSKSNGKLEIAETLGAVMTDELVKALRNALPDANVVTSAEKVTQTGGLVLDAYFSKLVPGSRAKRFWLGFGAGKSVTEISGEIHDRVSGRLVARFTHARLSWCCGFGSNDHEISTNLANAAIDIAAVAASHFDPSQSYTWLEQGPPSVPQPQAPKSSEQGTLKIEASSEHADVLVDNVFVGTTPVEVVLPIGSHQIVVKKNGFTDWTKDVHIMTGAKQNLWADLHEAAPQQP